MEEGVEIFTLHIKQDIKPLHRCVSAIRADIDAFKIVVPGRTLIDLPDGRNVICGMYNLQRSDEISNMVGDEYSFYLVFLFWPGTLSETLEQTPLDAIASIQSN